MKSLQFKGISKHCINYKCLCTYVCYIKFNLQKIVKSHITNGQQTITNAIDTYREGQHVD